MFATSDNGDVFQVLSNSVAEAAFNFSFEYRLAANLDYSPDPSLIDMRLPCAFTALRPLWKLLNGFFAVLELSLVHPEELLQMPQRPHWAYRLFRRRGRWQLKCCKRE
jgi:hypothetical protein